MVATSLSALVFVANLAFHAPVSSEQAAAPRQVRPPAAGAASGPSACPAGEGTRVEAPLGIVVCQGTARVTVRMAADAQPGVRVAGVVASGPAARAGLAVNDVIYLVDGVRVEKGAEVLTRLGTGTENAVRLQINFWRDGLPFIVRIPVEKR